MYTAILELENQLDQLLPTVGVHQHERKRYNLMVERSSVWTSAIWDTAQKSESLSFTQEQINQGLQFSKSAVFICGVHRSGTTLLRNLLDNHSALSVLPSEGTFITNQEKQLLNLNPDERCAFMCKEWLQRLVNSNNQAPYWLLGKTSEQHSPYIEFARIFKTWWSIIEKNMGNKNSLWPLVVVQLSYASIQNKFNKEITPFFWVDKTPTNERYLERLWKELPDAKIIHVLRNPEDVILSRQRINKDIPVRVFIKDLLMTYRVATTMSSKNDSRYLLMRYEDLCKDPVLTIKKTAAFLGIENSNVLLVSTVSGKEAEANSSFESKSKAGEILLEKDHKQKREISKNDYQLLAAAVGKPASKFGYQLPHISTFHSFWLKLTNRLW